MLQYRNEYKYLCSEIELALIKSRLDILMKRDENQSGDSYRIRSLYFDDHYDSAFYENEAGVDNRRKFRIRVYDNPADGIQLEIKYKVKEKTHKDSCALTRQMCDDLINNAPIKFADSLPGPLKELLVERQLHGMKPKIIIEYERSAYVCSLGNVRITFDRNIAYSKNIQDFFDTYMPLVPALRQGQHILEVKYDEFIPDYIMQIIQLGNLNRGSFSKYYYACKLAKGEEFYD